MSKLTFQYVTPWMVILLTFALMSFLAVPRWATALKITVGTVTDGAPQDLDPTPNSIVFNSNAAAPAGFALPGTSSVTRIQGKVELTAGPGAAALFVGSASIIRLTELKAIRFAGAGTDVLNLSFEHAFPRPPAPNQAAAFIDGTLNNFGGFQVTDSSISWRGRVNGLPIVPPDRFFLQTATPADPTPVPVQTFSGIFNVPVTAGPPWTLQGLLGVTLAQVGHYFELPASAEIGIWALDAYGEPKKSKDADKGKTQ